MAATSTTDPPLLKEAWPPGVPGGGTCPEEKDALPLAKLAEPLTCVLVAVEDWPLLVD